MEWNGVEWSGVEWNGVEWSGMEWDGMEWNGVEWSGEWLPWRQSQSLTAPSWQPTASSRLESGSTHVGPPLVGPNQQLLSSREGDCPIFATRHYEPAPAHRVRRDVPRLARARRDEQRAVLAEHDEPLLVRYIT